ncbi:DNA-directed DNA polymerase family A palm domain-containing protein [Cupriavidus necator]|uniref:DNA polymerase n=1 Tax=Cupriavidus necator TaxID=106590 RepID=UPI003F733BDD
MAKIFLFQKDFTNNGGDKLFIWANGEGTEVSPGTLANEEGELLCHDYWLIAPSIYKATGKLPPQIIDIEDFRLSIHGEKINRKSREQRSIFDALSDICDEQQLARYIDIFNRKSEFEAPIYFGIAPYIEQQWKRLADQAESLGEFKRYTEVERPVFNYLVSNAVRGIRIEIEKLREHKQSLEHQYYMALKRFAIAYNLPFEVPSDEEVREYLAPKGFDFSGVSLDYVLKFVPMHDSFAEDLLALRKLAESQNVLAAIPLSRPQVFPVVDIFGSVTSRIYYRDPALQNLSKRHRDILIPDDGFELSYVDYDQFEVGIMAALSEDPKLLELYQATDLYLEVAEKIFGNTDKRKIAKRLFLSYAYGMKLKGLMDAASPHGAQRAAVRDFFRQFSAFEKWKEDIAKEYESTGRIGTVNGNYLVRKSVGTLTDKERRSSVSQVVQGTASLIFKKALLRLKEEREVTVKLPMHDAVLVQHPPGSDTTKLPRLFAETMTEHFEGKIAGKASLEPFFEG